MEDYLKTLDMSELITYLEIEKQPGNFKKVEKILVSREKKMTYLKENLEIFKGKCSELTTSLEEERKKNVGVEGKCSKLMEALEVERKRNAGMEVKVADFEKLKMISIKLGEKAHRLEEECRIAREREKAAILDAATLLDKFEKANNKRLVDFDDLKAKNEILELALRKAADEIEGQKQRRLELEKKVEDETEAQKKRGVELEKMAEHVNELERDLEIHKRYKGVSEELEQKVIRLENERNIISGKEKSAREKIISLLGGVEKEKSEKERLAKLMDDLEKVNKKRNEELLELKGKNQDLEYAKQKGENEIAAQKKVRIELEKTMENTIKRVKELEEDLGTHKRYKTVCSELEEKVTRLERDCKNISEKEKNARERIANLLSDLGIEKSAKEKVTYLLGDLERLNMQLLTVNKSQDAAKRKADGEVETQKKRCEELEKTIQQKVKHSCDLDKELEMYKAKCSEFSEKISMKRDEKLMELKTKIKELENVKQKADEEIEAQKERYKELEKTMKNTNDLEKDLEVYKAKCSELSVALEENKKRLDEDAMLKKFNKYKAFCDEFREKVAHLDDCTIVPERKKSAKKRTSNISGILEITNGDRSDELNELNRHNKDLDCVKPNDGTKDRKRRHKKLETQVNQLNNETLALACEPQVPEKANLELGNEVSNKEGRKDVSKQGKVQSETNGGMNGTTCAAKLKIRLKPLNCICEGRVCNSVGADSICHSAVKASGTGQVEVPSVKRKQKRKRTKSDGGDDGDHLRRNKLKKDASVNQNSTVSHDGEQSIDISSHPTNSPRKYEKKDAGAENTSLKITSDPSSHHTDSPRKYEKKDAGAEKTPSKTCEPSETSVEKSANSIAENDKEKPKTTEGKSRRNVHPPNRLNL